MENPAIKPEKCNSIGDPIPNYSPKLRYLISFALGSTGLTIFSQFLSTLILIYGVSILGLSALFVGTIFSISQFIYAVLLPIFGNLSDHLKNSKIGKRTPQILIGIPLVFVFYHLFWVIPPCTQFGQIESSTAIYFSLTLIFYRVSVACIWASYQATIPDIAKTEPIQTQMNAYMYIFIYIGQIIGMILPMMILAQFPFTESAGDDYYWILNSNGIGQQIRDQIQARLVFMDIIVIVCFCIMFFFGHIPESARSQLVNLKNKSKLSFIQGFQQLFHDPDMLKIFVSNFLFLVVFGSINYIVVNFAVYSLQFGNLLYIFTILTIISSFSGFFLSNLFSSKIGLQKAFLVSNVVVSGLFLLMGVLFIPSPMIFIQIWASTLFLLASFLSAMIGVFFGSIVAKKSTTAENQTHQSRAGNYTSVYYSFGVFGNIVAVLWVSFMIEFLGSTALNTYILIFFICGMLNLGVFLLNRRLHLHSNPK